MIRYYKNNFSDGFRQVSVTDLSSSAVLFIDEDERSAGCMMLILIVFGLRVRTPSTSSLAITLCMNQRV